MTNAYGSQLDEDFIGTRRIQLELFDC